MKIRVLVFAIFILIFGCSEKQSVLDVSAHPDEWSEKEAVNFHGNYVKDNQTTSCKSCHGEMLDGGSSKTTCTDCHALYPHNPEFAIISSADFHGQYIKAHDWDMTSCQGCHGTSFNLPSSDNSCIACHTSPGGPIACHTCHGSMECNAPPRDLDGNLTTDHPGVGAHQLHLNRSEFTDNFECNDCHAVSYNFYADSHIDGDDRAEIEFGDLALQTGSADYSFNSLTCSNVYCHGNFIFEKDSSANDWAYNGNITGNDPDVVWNVVDGSQIVCGSCHNLPPEGHKPFSGQACANCHGNVVDADNNIIDKSLHINGEANIYLDGKLLF